MPNENPPAATNGERAEDVSAGGVKSMVSIPQPSQDARRRRDRIKGLLTSMTEQTAKVLTLLEQAQISEDHLALGYVTWGAYFTAEYTGLLEDLTRAQRREVVGALSAIGMSTRAIAPIVGTSHKTVVKDLQVRVVPQVPPEREDDLADPGADLHQGPEPTDRKITGLDGKSYTVQPRPVVEARKPRRGSLPDDYSRALYNLDKAVRRLEKLHADDRFMANRKALGNLHWAKFSDIDVVICDMESDLTSSTGGKKCEDCDKRVLPSRDFETRCKACAEVTQ